MNTREEIIAFLSQSEKPLGPKIIAFELKKSSVNIRKILSNLCKEGKITRVGFGEYKSSVNVLSEGVNVKSKSVNVEDSEAKELINGEINKYRKAYFKRLKISNPEAYGKMRKAKNKYLKEWRSRNPDYNKNWLRAYRKKHPEKFRVYERRYWLKRAMSSVGS